MYSVYKKKVSKTSGTNSFAYNLASASEKGSQSSTVQWCQTWLFLYRLPTDINKRSSLIDAAQNGPMKLIIDMASDRANTVITCI